MNLQEAIEKNRKRNARFRKAENLLRRVRQKIFDYCDIGKEEQANRIINRCKERLAPLWKARKADLADRKLQETPSCFEPGGCHSIKGA